MQNQFWTASMSSSIIKVVAQRIREARETAGLTQDELAQQVGLTRVRVNQIEQGRAKTIKPGNIQRIAGVLGKPEMYFYVETPQTLEALPEPTRTIISKLAALPYPQQEKLGRVMADIITWYETEVVS